VVYISNGFKKTFENLKDNFNKTCNGGMRRWFKFPIFAFISPFKCIVLIAVLLTLLLSGVGLYGLLVLILLVLLFIFIP